MGTAQMIKSNKLDGARLIPLADHLDERKPRLIESWLSSMRAHPDIAATEAMTRPQLADHLPDLFEHLVEQLRRAGTTDDAEPGPDARQHGSHRWRQGYQIDELFEESTLLRNILVQHLFLSFAKEGGSLAAEDERLARDVIQEFFDQLISESVAQYVEEQQRQIRQFATKLEENNTALAAANDSRIGLMRSVSHELRNSLEAQRILLAVISKNVETAANHDLVEVGKRNLTDMGTLLGQLLDYSALVAGQDAGEQTSFSAKRLWDDLVSTWRTAMEAADVEFEATLDEELGEISSDRLKLSQICRNLLSNSLKFRSAERRGKVEFAFGKVDDTRWRIRVKDNGIGIATEDLGKLFKEFSRIEPREHVSGSGLGLAITRQLAELLGGKIDVMSTKNEGSIFEVTLPLGPRKG